MQKRKLAMRVAKMVTKAVGAADLADYAGSKIAKARAKGSAKKFVEDKTSGKRAAVSAAALLASVAPGGALLRGAKVAKKGVSVAKKGVSIAKKAKPESRTDYIFRRQDEEYWKSKGYRLTGKGRIEKIPTKKK